MKILYLIRRQPDEMAKEMIVKHSDEHEITIVKLQDAVWWKENFPGRMFAIADDVRKRSASSNVPLIGYNDLLNLIFQNDRILCL